MYKKQLAAQKIICLFCVVTSAIVFVYSLGIMTDLYDALYSTMRNPSDLTQTDVPGSIVYYNMQDFNTYFVYASIGLILVSCLLLITNTHTRRRYYIGNYFSVALFSAAAVVETVWAHFQIQIYRGQFLQVDFEALKEHAEMWGTTYTDSTFWFDIHYLVFGLLIIAVILLIVNTAWKVSLMKDEQVLINEGREEAKA